MTKQHLVLFISFIVGSIFYISAFIFYINAFTGLIFFIENFRRLFLEMQPYSMPDFLGNDNDVVVALCLILSFAVIVYHYKQNHAPRFILGVALCFAFCASLIFAASMIVIWQVNIDFSAHLVGIHPPDMTVGLQVSLLALLSAIVCGFLTFMILKAWRVFYAYLMLVALFSFSAAALANFNNISFKCFINGYWEGSSVFRQQLEYSTSDDINLPISKTYPAIYYISSFYLSGPLMDGETCYALGDEKRFNILKKILLHRSNFPEFRPIGLEDMIINRSEKGDVPAMLLLAHMYSTGNSAIPKDYEMAKSWFERAISSFSVPPNWLIEEKKKFSFHT
ncbi:MAG: SEL1-like repeat protein [Proteobacteria bacterium]|nr:SEL1-like repeat protein [Pseudomonadota bacterium]